MGLLYLCHMANEKPQWTTTQVIAVVGAIGAALGFGGTKAVDAVYKPETVNTESRYMDTLIAEIGNNVTTIREELRMYRQANKQDHEELREDLKSVNERLRSIEKKEYAEVKERLQIYANSNAE